MASITAPRREVVQVPSLFNRLFTDVRAAWLWLPLRLWLGYQWIEASSHKIGNPAWTQTGTALKGFWTSAVAMPENGRAPIAFGWYRSFIQALLDAEAYTWFAKLIAYGELLIGIGLIVGAVIGVTAFFAAFMNWNFMMAGSASINPMLFVIAIGLLLAWRVSGQVGVDYAIFNRSRLMSRLSTLRTQLFAGR
jgi:thiosulfate dehydrogenase [quinone] large subunit